MKVFLLISSLALVAGAIHAADLQVQTSGLPDDVDAVITVVNEANGASVTLGLDATSRVRFKDLASGAVTVKAAPVEYQGMTFSPDAPEAFMLLQQYYPDTYLRMRDFFVRHPPLATSIDQNLYGHTITYTTSTPPSTSRLFAGLDLGILWDCDTTIPNSCGDLDNAGSKQDMTHLAYGGGYVWASLLNTGGVDDSLLWKCDANTMNACVTWDLWPKQQVTISSVAYDNGRVYVSWWESGLATGSTGIKSCDALAQTPNCFDVVLNNSNGVKIIQMTAAVGRVYFVDTAYSAESQELQVCNTSPVYCAYASYTPTYVTNPNTDTNSDPRDFVSVLSSGSNGSFYGGSHYGALDLNSRTQYSMIKPWHNAVIKMQPNASANGWSYVNWEVIWDYDGASVQKPRFIAEGLIDVYVVSADNSVHACSFTDLVCQTLPTWGTSGQGDITALAAGGGKVFLGYSGGKMLQCDENALDQACISFNTAGQSLNDMVFVVAP